MNKKKRVISLAMALIMILGVLVMIPITANATGTFDYRDAFIGESANDFIDLGNGRDETEDVKKLANAPNLTDGVISEDEYTYTRTDLALNYFDDHTPAAPVTQYVAHDDEWVYLAFDVTDFNLYEGFDIYLHPLQIFDNASASYIYMECLNFGFAPNSNNMSFYGTAYNQGDLTTHVKSGSFAYDNTTYSGKMTLKIGEGNKIIAVIETKFSKAALAEAASVEVEDFTSFRYMAEFNNRDYVPLYVCWPVQYLTGSTTRVQKLIASSAILPYYVVNNYSSFWAISVDLADELTVPNEPIPNDPIPGVSTSEAITTPVTSTPATTGSETTGAETTGAETTGTEITGTETTGAETTGTETMGASSELNIPPIQIDMGCEGSLAASMLAILPILAGGVLIARKRED